MSQTSDWRKRGGPVVLGAYVVLFGALWLVGFSLWLDQSFSSLSTVAALGFVALASALALFSQGKRRAAALFTAATCVVYIIWLVLFIRAAP